jgi:hypothetical protein
VNNGGEYINEWLFDYVWKNKLFGSIKKRHELVHQPTT